MLVHEVAMSFDIFSLEGSIIRNDRLFLHALHHVMVRLAVRYICFSFEVYNDCNLILVAYGSLTATKKRRRWYDYIKVDMQRPCI